MFYTSTIQQVKQQWEQQGISFGNNITSNDIKRFEFENSVILPLDFCEYLTTLNGMADNGRDSDFMGFWPIEKIKPCIRGTEPDYQVITENFYIFADYSIGVFYYAIEFLPFFSPSNRICAIGGAAPIFIAQSFTEFLNIYLAGEALSF